jgi:hypothetical protein
MIQTLKFYGKLSAFSIKEEQSSLSATLAGLLLYPCFIWIFSKLWLGLNNNVSTLGTVALFAYIGLTEILFMTSLREPFIDRASSDFSLSFVRPRVWPLYTSISIYSRTLFRRVVYLLLYILIMPVFTDSFELSWRAAMRFILFLPLITILESMYSFLLTCVQIRFYSIKNFRMLFGKLFLIFGGVLAPLSDIPGRWQKIFINTPFSDLIFQPCYFSIKGEFYHLTLVQWLVRIGIQFACVYLLAHLVYKSSRQHYHNFGG